MGSPEFSLPSLSALAHSYPIVGVVTQPDRPSGRGRIITAPPVKHLAQKLSLPIIQPKRLNNPGAMQQLREWSPELIVVVAFGQILRAEVLDLPVHGCINIHASLLPRWRGAAPVQAALLHGDQESGVTIMRMDEGVDTGPILSQRTFLIKPDDTALTLSSSLAQVGADLLIETLPPYLQGELAPQPQSDYGVTYAPMLKKDDGKIDFSRRVADLVNQVRAFNPWPGTFIPWQSGQLKIHRAHSQQVENTIPGAHRVIDGFPAVEVQDGLLILDEVQPAGKKTMSGDVFLRGVKNW